MENTDTIPAEINGIRSPSPSQRDKFFGLIILSIIIGAGLIVGTYYFQKTKATKIVDQNSSLRAQLYALNKESQQQKDINNGVVPISAVYKAPAGHIGLINGLIIMTLPKGWVSLPTQYCTGGTIDSDAVCQDITNVTPSSLVGADGTAKWSISVAAYSYDGSTSARNWYYSVYEGEPADSDVTGSMNESTTSINGYSTYTYQQSLENGTSEPDYTYAYYILAHSKYAVVVSALVQTGSVYEADSFDYTNTYQPLIDQMIKTIKFND